jgi:hypothetical protein
MLTLVLMLCTEDMRYQASARPVARAKPAHAPGIEHRFASQTAPVYAQPQRKQQPAARKPASNTERMTRRVSMPIAKGPVPAIAVTGMGGLRVLKQQQQAQMAAQGRGRGAVATSGIRR